MTYAASGRGPAASSSVSTLTPAKVTSNFDQVVTQWMSPKYDDPGSAWISRQVQVRGVSTRPSTVIVHFSGSRWGVTSAVSVGQPGPVSYWPGGSRSDRAPASRRRPVNTRVTGNGPFSPAAPESAPLRRDELCQT